MLLRSVLWSSFIAACSNAPPASVEFDAAVDSSGTAHRIHLNRGLLVAVEPRAEKTTAKAVPGRFALWTSESLPSPDKLAELLSEGYTSLVIPGYPLVESIALREYVGTARNRGPRVFVSGPSLCRTQPTESRCRTQVQDAAAVGADFVVIDQQAGVSVVCAVAEEGRRQKIRVWLRGRGAELANVQQRCAADAVWVSDSATQLPSRSNTSGVWIVDRNHALPVESPELAHFNDQSTSVSGTAKTLNVEDAIGKVAVGFRGDLLLTSRGRTKVFLDGVEQNPSAPWFASFALAYTEWQLSRSLQTRNPIVQGRP